MAIREAFTTLMFPRFISEHFFGIAFVKIARQCMCICCLSKSEMAIWVKHFGQFRGNKDFLLKVLLGLPLFVPISLSRWWTSVLETSGEFVFPFSHHCFAYT